MDRKLIEIRDSKLRGMRDSLEIAPSRGLRGHVEIYEKKNGQLERLQENHNLIVFGGRQWLLSRAFGQNLTGANQEMYNKTLSWFGVGTGGGEPGNPLQAGATRGNDTQLISQTALRPYVNNTTFKSRYCRKPEIAGKDGDNNFYYKKFSSVVIKEDVSNPYMNDSGQTAYPPIVAEVRIELASQDACSNDEYTDINEAALFASNKTQDIDLDINDTNTFDADDEKIVEGCGSVPLIRATSEFDTYVTYTLSNEFSAFANVHVGDRVYLTGTTQNPIPQNNKALVVDVDTISHDWSFTVEKANGVNEIYTSDAVHATFTRGGYAPFTMFSRVTFSTIRKTTDREIVFLWKVYF